MKDMRRVRDEMVRFAAESHGFVATQEEQNTWVVTRGGERYGRLFYNQKTGTFVLCTSRQSDFDDTPEKVFARAK
jgi:hypothetical protein